MILSFTLNGDPTEWEIHPGETLLEALRRHGHYGVKRGCNTGDCGVCTVHLDGEAVRSCQIFAAAAAGRAVTTIEGLAERHPETGETILHPLQQRFIMNGAIQCGYCIPGMLMSAAALLEQQPRPAPEEVKRALDGNLCRCTGYVKQAQSVLEAAADLAGEPGRAWRAARARRIEERRQ